MGIVTDGLVGYWHYAQGYNNGVWQNIAPATVGQYNGTVNGGVSLVSDGVTFDGTTGYINIGALPLLTGLSSFTLQVLVGSVTSGATSLYSIGLASDSSNRYGITFANNYPKFTSVVNSATNSMSPSSNTLGSGMATVTVDSSGRKLYLNNSSPNKSDTTTITLPTINYVSIGCIYYGTPLVPNYFFNGKIRAVRIYNRALTQAEITQNYNVANSDTGLGTTGTVGTTNYNTKQSLYNTGTLAYNLKQALYQTLSQSFDTKLQQYQNGSMDMDSRQELFNQSSILMDSKQDLYNQLISPFDSKQVLYKQSSDEFNTKQSIFKLDATQYDSKQVIYHTASTLYDTLQQLVNAGLLGSTSFDTSMVLYQQNQKLFDTKQSIFNVSNMDYDLKQSIYNTSQTQGDINLILYAHDSVTSDLLQRIYSDGVIDFDTTQSIFDPDKTIIGTVRLKGNQNLNIYLVGKQSLNVNLKGVIE